MAAKQLTPKQALAALKKEEREIGQRSQIVAQKIWDLERQIEKDAVGDVVGKCFRGSGIKDVFRVLEVVGDSEIKVETVNADMGQIARYRVSSVWTSGRASGRRKISQESYDKLKAEALKKLGLTEAKS